MRWTVFLFLWRLLGWLLWPILRFHPRCKRGIPSPEPGAIWIHGASLGEHQAVQALSKTLKSPLWRTYSSWRSTVSSAFPAPLDVPWMINSWLDWSRPRALLLIEAELWPGWLAGCRQRNIPIYVLNYRESNSSNHWRKWSLWHDLTKDIIFLSQQEFGDLKQEAPLSPCELALPTPCLIAGSTRNKDEEYLLTAMKELPEQPFLVLAPRHLNRIPAIEALLRQKNLRYALRSQWNNEDIAVLLLDTHGELASLYQYAQAAFVGGTFSPSVGGHSPVEANRFGLPVIAGPHRNNNIEAWKSSFLFPVQASSELSSALNSALKASAQVTQHRDIAKRYLQQISQKHPIPQESIQRPLLQVLQPLWKAVGSRLPSYQPLQQQWSIPIVSVGGLAAGGSGKTPVCSLLAKHFPTSVVLSRGYRRAKGTDLRTTGDIGDELTMLQRQGISVISSPNRHKGIAFAQEQGAQMVILDDAFQHRKVHRDIDIVCIDCRWPTSRGLIPAGWAREPWENVERADWIWLHHYHPDLPLPPLPHQRVIRSWMKPTGWNYKGEFIPLDKWNGLPKLVCGIARPEGVFQQLHNLNIPIEDWTVLSDHAPLPADVEDWICTEKDAARLPSSFPIWALQCELITDGAEKLLLEIKQCCG